MRPGHLHTVRSSHLTLRRDYITFACTCTQKAWEPSSASRSLFMNKHNIKAVGFVGSADSFHGT